VIRKQDTSRPVLPGPRGTGYLTPRQAEVLKLAARGMGYKQIAFRLGISRRTVEDHFRKMRARTGARTRAELLTCAAAAGLVQPELGISPADAVAGPERFSGAGQRNSVGKRSFVRQQPSGSIPPARPCNGSRVRANVTLSGVSDTVPGMRIGYGRVSARDQHPEAQHDALTAAGCEQIFIDNTSGTLASYPELDKALLAATRRGGQLVVTTLGQLGHSLEHLIQLSKDLECRGVDLVILDQGIDTSTAVGHMFFHILAAIAEFEHALMSERTRDGLAAARARGRTGGQKPKLGPCQVALARQMYDERDVDGHRYYTVAQIAAKFGVTRPTIYRHLSKGTT
jgi:DNA invertase Pin-like site-specific DNA recombinase